MKSGGILLIVVGTWVCFQVLGGEALYRLNVITHSEDLGNVINGQGHALPTPTPTPTPSGGN